jgi:hypothetical protein
VPAEAPAKYAEGTSLIAEAAGGFLGGEPLGEVSPERLVLALPWVGGLEEEPRLRMPIRWFFDKNDYLQNADPRQDLFEILHFS